MEESRILQDPWVAMPDLEGHLVPGQGLLGQDCKGRSTDPWWRANEALVDDLIVEANSLKNLEMKFKLLHFRINILYLIKNS